MKTEWLLFYKYVYYSIFKVIIYACGSIHIKDHAMRNIRTITVLALCACVMISPARTLAQRHTAQETWYLTLNHYKPHKTLGYATIPIVTRGGLNTSTDRTLEGLIEGFRHMTEMEVYHGGIIPLDSPSLTRYPIIAVEPYGDDPLERNSENIRNYIDAGGFVILGEPNPKMQRASFGKGISIRPIPLTHPIYDCFFAVGELGFHGSWGETGIWNGNELVGICSNTLPGQWSETYSRIPDTQMKRSVNIIVYGLMRSLE